jgi:hypothetical protein
VAEPVMATAAEELTVVVHQADPPGSTRPGVSVIRIAEPIPATAEAGTRAAQDLFTSDAQAIFDVLYGAVPSGVLVELRAILMDRLTVRGDV